MKQVTINTLSCLVILASILCGPISSVFALDTYQFTNDAYSLYFHSNGLVYVNAIKNGSPVSVGTVGRYLFDLAGINTSGAPITITVDEAGVWPEVLVNYQLSSGTVSALWTLMPKMAHVEFTASPASGSTGGEGVATLSFTMGTSQFVQAIKPARWYPGPGGGYPYQLTAGMADQYITSNVFVILANDKGLESLYESSMINMYARESSGLYYANAVISFDNSTSALPLAVSAAGQESIMLNVISPEPFYLWDSVSSPMTLTAEVVNLSSQSELVTLTYTARDYDGQVVGTSSPSMTLAPLESWQVPISLTISKPGPVWMEVVAQHSQGSETQHVSLGVLAPKTFLDGSDSRFGISGYRGGVGAHTEARTESQMLGLMSDIGVRQLRAAANYYLAHQAGITTWHGSDLTGQVKYDYWAGLPTWCDTLEYRENFLSGALSVADSGDHVCFEFTNEWNSYGGEGNAVLAQKYADDWLIPMKSIRDASYPDIKLSGCVIANGDQAYMQGVYNAGAWDCFDILSFHAMGTPNSCDFDNYGTYWSYLATLRRVHESMRLYGTKDLWMTEFYAPTAPNNSLSNNERATAEDLTLQIAIAVAADVKGFMLHCFDDYDIYEEIKTAAEVGEAVERECYFGLVRRDWTPKATLWAYQTAAYYFDGATFTGDVVMSDPGNDIGMAFSGNNGDFVILWSRNEGYLSSLDPSYKLKKPWEEFWENEKLVTFPASSTVTVVNCVGQSYTLTPSGGSVTINLTGALIYVFGLDVTTEEGRFSELFGEPTVIETEFDEDFEGTTFPPEDWTTNTAASTWVNHYVGHNGRGGNTPTAGHGLSLDDYNASGYCLVTSYAYETTGLLGIGFDFAYQAGSGSVLYKCDVDPSSNSAGLYLQFVGGYLYYYNNGWYVVTSGGANMTFDATAGRWHRIFCTLIDQTTGQWELSLTDMTTGVTQNSDQVTSNLAGGSDERMMWWTNTNSVIIFSIDNVLTLYPDVPIPGDANDDGMVDVGDLGILAANYGGSGKTWEEGDFNGDGLVDVGDLGILAANYGTGKSGGADFNADYAKVFETSDDNDLNEQITEILDCEALGLPLIAGLFLMCLMIVKMGICKF